MSLNANMMARLRFLRGLSIDPELDWESEELKEIAREYKELELKEKALDLRLENLIKNDEICDRVN